MTPQRYEKIRALVNRFYDAGVNPPDETDKVSDIRDTWPLVRRELPDLTRSEFDTVCHDIVETIDRQMANFWRLS